MVARDRVSGRKLELRLPYDMDVEQVRGIIKRIGIDIMEDPVFGAAYVRTAETSGTL